MQLTNQTQREKINFQTKITLLCTLPNIPTLTIREKNTIKFQLKP